LSKTGEGIIPTEDTCSGVFGALIEGGYRFEFQNKFRSQKLVAAAKILLSEGAWERGGNFFIPQIPEHLGGKFKQFIS
jgi:hypothetical protein